jgi:hypothetical protein
VVQWAELGKGLWRRAFGQLEASSFSKFPHNLFLLWMWFSFSLFLASVLVFCYLADARVLLQVDSSSASAYATLSAAWDKIPQAQPLKNTYVITLLDIRGEKVSFLSVVVHGVVSDFDEFNSLQLSCHDLASFPHCSLTDGGAPDSASQ